MMVGQFKPAHAQSTSIQLSVQDSDHVSGTIFAPVTVSNVMGREVYAFQGELEYDPAVFEFVQFKMIDLTSDFSMVSNPYQPGRVKFASYGVYPFTSDGKLMEIEFKSLQQDVTSEVFFTYFMFNEGNPTVSGHPGDITVYPGNVTVTGKITYWSNGVPVPDVKITYTDRYKTQPITATTDVTGSYTIALPYNAEGRMIASKVSEDPNITIYDAAHALGCYVYGWNCNPFIGDVTGDLLIGAPDARAIARYALGYRDETTKSVGHWFFSFPYTQFYGLKEDYNVPMTAMRKGELSGNYGGILTAASVADAQDFFSIMTSSDTITIGFSGFPVQSVQFELAGNITVEEIKAEGFEVLNNGNIVGIYRDSQVESFEIIMDISVLGTTQIAINDFRIDDDMLFYEVWHGIVGPGPDPIYTNLVLLPLIERSYADQEQMPELIED